LQKALQNAIIIAVYSLNEKAQFAAARSRMVQEHLKSRDIVDEAILRVMGQLPREEFISAHYQSQAYADGPLPIGMGQTISQPYIVALMTQVLAVTDDCEVLEIGTGSGYQTAVLAKLAKKVYTIERFSELSESAQAVLGRLGIENVEFYVGDGSLGWCEPKTFDRIIITAAVPKPPEPVLGQLGENGMLVAPIGPALAQTLYLFEKTASGLRKTNICNCRFVKLLGRYGFKETED